MAETTTAERDPEATLRAEAQRHLARNTLAHIGHGLFGQTGFRLIQAPTFVPFYVHALSGSDFVVGLARSLQSLGNLLSPLLGATIVERRRRVLPLAIVFGGLMRLQVLGIALCGFFLPREWNLVAVCGFLGLFGFFLGLQGVTFNVIVSKVIPVERRGFLMGLRQTAGTLVVALAGGLGGWLIDRDVLGNGYAATFGLAFVLSTTGLVIYSLIREPDAPNVRARVQLGARFAELPALLRSDPHFTRYFVARALGTMGRTAQPFYILLARERFGVTGTELGILTAAFTLAWGGSALVWGVMADRLGFRAVFLSALALWMGAALSLVWIDSSALLVAVFAALGAGFGGFGMSGQNMVLEFGSRENLPMRVALANSASELMNTIGPLLGGALAVAGSYPLVIGVAVGFQAVAFFVVAFLVQDPRHRDPDAGSPA